MEKIIIENFGPISYFEAEVKDIMIFIGPQASGKSTIAKLIWFFKSVKNFLIELINNVVKQSELYTPNGLIEEFKMFLDSNLKATFEEISNNRTFQITYYYSEHKSIKIILPKEKRFSENVQKFAFQFTWTQNITTELDKIFIEVVNYKQNFYQSLSDKLRLNSEKQNFLTVLTKHINKFFGNDQAPIFIPAARSLLSFLKLTNLNFDSFNINILDQGFIGMTEIIKPEFQNDLREIIDIIKGNKQLNEHGNNFEEAEIAIEIINKILKGKYKVVDEEERLYFNAQNYVKLKYASSGQQEALWIVLLIFKFILDEENVFTVFEEPEAHLYPEAQNEMVKLMALLANVNQNQIIITTHSPYILSAFNNLLYAHQIGQDKPDEVSQLVNPKLWLDVNRTSAYFIDGDSYESIIDPDLNLIQAEKIDSASRIINETFDQLFDLDN
ncbi:conserved hypothetical protein [Gloeothece citriformis PCC 7424]|uniref:Endonuclease GajA/Old nuclease/RecF-like AAA domain-containing protein n=1 Tax=Gloeothece citriformis (strain PCC 7424) TaxID=65393 RepID=B7KLB6_GLOC7|nr:ATP-binding protein [Gloeothece citriformis]ACK72488.1 conserved hypothetical protein [Gloeothece citriformis PCC 7424]